MDQFLEEKQTEPKGINYGLIIGVAVGLLLIGAAALIISMQPPAEDERAKILEGAYREGSPEFAELTKDIIISTDLDRTIESPTGLGNISVYPVGRVRNRGSRTITLLEVHVALVDTLNNPIKEKYVLVIPERTGPLGPNETYYPLTLAFEGIDPKADRANIRWKVSALKAD
jgi:hypothetical protein